MMTNTTCVWSNKYLTQVRTSISTNIYVVVFFYVFNDLRWEVVVRFEDNFLSFFLQIWTAVLLCQRTPAYYGRIVVKTLYTPAPTKSCAAFKNVCIHQCVQKCVYMYTVRTRFYTNFYIVSKRKQNDQFRLKGLKIKSELLPS